MTRCLSSIISNHHGCVLSPLGAQRARSRICSITVEGEVFECFAEENEEALSPDNLSGRAAEFPVSFSSFMLMVTPHPEESWISRFDRLYARVYCCKHRSEHHEEQKVLFPG